jgi:Tfp pilus assembly protein PilF
MKKHIQGRTVLLLAFALFMTACATPLVRTTGLDKLAPRNAERDLSTGIRAYEEGDYKTAPKFLQSALGAGLLLNSDKVAAHKHLAFIYCAQSRVESCRNEFRRAFEIDPQFELSATESGHPMWRPVFKEVAIEMAKRQPQK